MITYIVLLLIVCVILMWVTHEQEKTILNQEETIKITNDYWKNFKKTCGCCEAINEGLRQEYQEQIQRDTDLINDLKKRIYELEHDRW